MLEASPIIPVDEAITKYQCQLDVLCKVFDASSYQDLMTRADSGEFSPTTCSMILDAYSFLIRKEYI